MTPLLVMAIGRSGTTYLMRLLASTPQIVALDSYPMEFRPYQLSIFGERPEFPDARDIRNKIFRFPGDEALLYEPFAAEGRLSQARARAVYRHLAVLAGKDARYFAEKTGLLRDMAVIVSSDPGSRIAVLVRDPRDVFLSQRAFKMTSLDLADWLGVARLRFQRLIERLDGPPAVWSVRFETLIEAPHRTLADLLGWLRLANDDATVAAAVTRARALEDGRHITAAAPVDRWRTELSKGERDLFVERFGDILARLSYPID